MRTNLTPVLSSKINLSSVPARMLVINLLVVLFTRYDAIKSVSSAIFEYNTESMELERRRNSITKDYALHTVTLWDISLFTYCSAVTV